MPRNGTQGSAEWRRLNDVFGVAVELPLNEQEAYLDKSCGDDMDLRAQAAGLLEAARKIGEANFLSDDAFQIGARVIAAGSNVREPKGRHIGRFKIVSEIAHGGMGVVYLAERDDFQQRVALKLIREGFDSAEILRRFRVERDVLASLNHPNIARLLDGGTTDDGQPFLAIEYVDGERIDQYCNGHELDLNARLALFQKVCAAVAYAHQNLTVHRDLKPSNILVMRNGEPKLLDFGIAKILAGAASPDDTATADRLLTPEYASPEQLRGSKISTASDVYSLGVLLFELLTGRRPFELKDRSAFEIVDAVCNTEAPTPSSRAAQGAAAGTRSIPPSQLKGDLDNIILTALRKDPALRYSSVEQLSEDVRRHVTGLPIVARPTTFKYRAGKFVRRNRVPVAFATVAVIALVVGAAIASWQAVVARSEAERAKQRFNDVRTLANTFVSDWHEGIPEESISPEIRARLANISSDYLAKLAADTDDPQVLREAADAQIKLGHEYAYFMIDTEKARASLRNAEQIARRLTAADPDDKTARSLLIRSLMKYTEFFGPENIETSISSRREQIALRELNLADDATDVNELRDLAILHEQTGGDLRRQGNTESARLHFERSDELHARRITVVESLPLTSENAARLATTLSMRAWNFVDNLSDATRAREYASRAVETAIGAVAAFPSDRAVNVAVINAYFEHGIVLKRGGDHREAINSFRASIDANQRFGQNRTDGYLSRREYDGLLEIADSLHAIGDDSAAMEALRRCLQVRREGTARQDGRDSLRTFVSHAFLMELAGGLFGQMGRKADAELLFAEAESFLEKVPNDPRHKATTGLRRAALMIRRGDLIAGVSPCLRVLAAPGPIDESCVRQFVSEDRRQVERAVDYYRQAIETITSLPSGVPRTFYDEDNRRAAEDRIAKLGR